MTFDESLHPRGKGAHGGEWVKKLSDSMDSKLSGDHAYNSVAQADSLPNADVDAINAYAGGSFAWINKFHRNGADTVPAPGRPIIQRQSDALDAMFASAPPLKNNIEVLRGVDSPNEIFGPVGSLVGKSFMDKAYLSTTTDSKVQDRFSLDSGSARITIHIPSGTRVMAMALNGDKREKEILLSRGSRFRVASDILGARNIRQIELELLT